MVVIFREVFGRLLDLLPILLRCIGSKRGTVRLKFDLKNEQKLLFTEQLLSKSFQLLFKNFFLSSGKRLPCCGSH